MKATLIIEQRGQGYIYDLFSDRETKRGVRCGLTPQATATEATKILAQLHQAEGEAAVVAPAEILALIPEHLTGGEPAQKAVRLKVIEWVADLLLAIYHDKSKIPGNVERFALHNPMMALGLITQRREMPTNSPQVAELMDKIDNPDILNFSRPANLEERAAFDIRLHKSPYQAK